MTPDDLRARRDALHLSQKQLAEALGVSKSTVSHWEQGAQGIPAYLDLALQTLERIVGESVTTNLDEAMALIEAYADACVLEHDVGNRPHLYDETLAEMEERAEAARDHVCAYLATVITS